MQAAAELGLDTERLARELDDHVYAERVSEDFSSARRSGARATPTFFINGRRYDGPWDEESLLEAIEQPLGLKIRLLAQEFAGLSASAGLMMIIGAVLALVWANSPWGRAIPRCGKPSLPSNSAGRHWPCRCAAGPARRSNYATNPRHLAQLQRRPPSRAHRPTTATATATALRACSSLCC